MYVPVLAFLSSYYLMNSICLVPVSVLLRTFREPDKVHNYLGTCMCFIFVFAIKGILCVPCFHCCWHRATDPLSFAALRDGRCMVDTQPCFHGSFLHSKEGSKPTQRGAHNQIQNSLILLDQQDPTVSIFLFKVI